MDLYEITVMPKGLGICDVDFDDAADLWRDDEGNLPPVTRCVSRKTAKKKEIKEKEEKKGQTCFFFLEE
jgi:hypothetical protein